MISRNSRLEGILFEKYKISISLWKTAKEYELFNHQLENH